MSKLPKTMTFSCLVKKGQCEIRKRPIPVLKDYDVLIKMKVCNICTVDYQQFMGLREHQGYPMAGGHEGCGEIIAIGSKVKDFQIGDLVALGYQGCGHCLECRHGNVSACESFRQESEDGYKFGEFGFADYTVKSVDGLYKLNPDLDPSQAAFTEPLATVISGMKKVHVKPFETVVVIGAGPMGLLNALVARAYGARVIVSELLDAKLETARQMGFLVVDSKMEDPVQRVMEITDDDGADVVIGAVANSKAYEQGILMLKKSQGRFLVFAAGHPEPELHISANDIHYKEMEIVGTYGGTNEDFEDAAKALSTGMIDVSALVEARYPLKDMQKAYQAAVDGNYRISIVFHDE